MAISVPHEEKNILQTHAEKITLDPLSDGISSLELVRVSGSDVDIVNAARVSYGKFIASMTDRDKKLINFLIEHDHTSPFEHNQLSFRVKAPIFVARQWMRHRMHSYNEISYRYVQAPFEYYTPPAWRYQDTQNKQSSVGTFNDTNAYDKYHAAIKNSYETYEYLLQAGVARELARGILPLCTYTEFIFTTNLHALMNFLRLRLHAGAQHEIKLFAASMLKLSLPHFPASLSAWQKKHVPDLHDQFTGLFTNLIS